MKHEPAIIPATLLDSLRTLGISPVFVYLLLLREFKLFDVWHEFTYRSLTETLGPGAPSSNTVRKALGALIDMKLVVVQRGANGESPSKLKLVGVSNFESVEKLWKSLNPQVDDVSDSLFDTKVSPSIHTLSEKEKGVKESARGKGVAASATEVRRIFDTWNAESPHPHSKLTEKMERSVRSAHKRVAKTYADPTEQIIQAIKNYGKVTLGAQYWWNHKWTLIEFLSTRRSKEDPLNLFLDENKPLERYTHKARGAQPVTKAHGNTRESSAFDGL